MTTERDLKPCPFCGGKAVSDSNEQQWNWIECASCGASTNMRVSTLDDCMPLLIEQWNRRTTIQPEPVSVPEEMVPVAYGGMAGYHDYKIGNVTIVSSAEYAKGWNQCRRAMLAAAPSVQQSDESEPKPGLMRESGTQAEPQLFGKAEQVPDSFKQGVEAAALLIDRKAELYAERFGHDDMGALSFGSGAHAEIKRDTHSGLIELAEEIRATFLVQQPEVQQPAQALTDFDIVTMANRIIDYGYLGDGEGPAELASDEARQAGIIEFARAIEARAKGGA